MKRTIIITLLMIFTLGVTTTFANKKELKSKAAVDTEKKLSKEEVNSLTIRLAEIRDTDKSDMTVTEKRDLRKEKKATKKNIRKNGGSIYIGGTTLLVIIILILIL